MRRATALACLYLLRPAPAQELLWQIASTTDDYGISRSFGDLDGDGGDDLLLWYHINLYGGGPQSAYLRILSGATGAILDDNPTVAGPMYEWKGVGDFDGDGYPDYAVSWDDQGYQNLDHVQVWSPHLDQQLLHLSGPRSSTFAGRLAGHVDLNGDGLPDLVIASTHPSNPDVRAYDHSGSLMYRVALGPLNKLPLDVMGLRDLDGDGCSEILVGGGDYTLGYTRGMLAVLSGRTGAFLRVTYDELTGDFMGYPIASAGDVDRDGFEDYATGNYWGGSGSGRKILSVYSGATGAILRQWQVPIGSGVNLATSLIGGRDVDLDGVPDVIAGTHAWDNGTGRDGRIHAFSSADMGSLLHTEPSVDIINPSYGFDLADLGPQPGSHFPVFATTYRPRVGPPYRRLEAWRCSLPGERVTGTGCASLGLSPTVSVRRVTTAQGEQCRVVLGSAPPGAMAFCVAAGQGETTFAGAPLPYSMAALGFPGCSLLVPPTLIEARLVGTTGFDRGYAGIDAPFQVGNGGFGAAVQWLTFDFTTGVHAASPRCEVQLR